MGLKPIVIDISWFLSMAIQVRVFFSLFFLCVLPFISVIFNRKWRIRTFFWHSS